MDMIGWIGVSALACVVLAWFAFALVFITRTKVAKSTEARRESAAFFGIAVQSVGFALVWNVRRNPSQPLFPSGPLALHIALSVCAILLASLSIAGVMSAVRTLGKQWSFAARVVTDHELITEGVYRRVRHPIYAGMMGMMIATGLVLSRPWALVVAAVFGFAGTLIRVRLEERLLTATFGDAYRKYAQRVPALIPSLGTAHPE